MDGINKSSSSSGYSSTDDNTDKVDATHLGRKANITTTDDPLIAGSQPSMSNSELSEKNIDDFKVSRLNSDDYGRFSITDDLSFVKELGQGGFGSVWLVDSSDGKDKYAFKWPFDSKCLSAEVEKMDKVPQHPNLIESFGIAEIDGKEGILMEYIPGEDLSKILPKITEHYLKGTLSHSDFWGTIQFILKETLLGVRHLEVHRCAHQDIKPQNIRVHKERLVPVIIDLGNLADFGQTGKIGTELYSTPESFSSCVKAEVSDKFDTYSI